MRERTCLQQLDWANHMTSCTNKHRGDNTSIDSANVETNHLARPNFNETSGQVGYL